ncbi:hypothetical protein niasHT_003025 [Heterodera trifolii]|uniref:Secreted protein n=1 Tax=Heterodera trifolii TaxID=157864 RepID=A0ABD2M4T8_9BILA
MRQCCCCAIIIVFSLFVAFLKFNSIDAGCGGSKHTEIVNWQDYCRSTKSNNRNRCNNHQVHPCISSTRGCTPATINAAPNLPHNAAWKTFCTNNRRGCNKTVIKPCHWNANANGNGIPECVAKQDNGIFARVNRA